MNQLIINPKIKKLKYSSIPFFTKLSFYSYARYLAYLFDI